jgi:phenylalanyl-tRNA synthetase beta chain
MRDLRNRVQDALAAAGMQEVMTYPLTSLETLRRVVPDDWLADHPPVAIANPLTAGEERLRVSLRASVLQAAAANARIEDGVVALFETARVFLPRDGQQPLEQERVTGVVTGRRPDRWGRPSDESVDFYDAKACVQALFDSLGVAVEYVASQEYGLLPGRTAELRAGGRAVGVLGQVHPETAASFDLDRDVYLFDICLDDLLPLLPGPRRYVPVPRFPAVEEDLAIVVGRETPAARVRALLLAHPLVVYAEPFDEYTGPPVPEGRKSLAFALRYQAPDRTLSDAEVARVRESLVARLRRELGAELRR